jgi:hypothetical protein
MPNSTPMNVRLLLDEDTAVVLCRPDAWGRVSFAPTPVSILGWMQKKKRARYLHSGPVVGRPGRLTAYMGGVCGKGPLMTGGCAGAGSGDGIRL